MKGFTLLKQAADDKSPLAQTLTAGLYECGTGTEKDTEKALYYYLLAAKQGEPRAKEKLKKLRGGLRP